MPNPVIMGFDRAASRIIGALHKLFGFQYSRDQEFYVYQADVESGTADAAGTNYSTAIRFTQEADFICTRINVGSRISSGTGQGNWIGQSAAAGAAGDLPDAPFTLKLIDGSSDRQMMNKALDAALAFGTYGGLPGVWPKARLFARNTTLTIELSSLKAVPASTKWRHYVQLVGFKIFDVEALDLTTRRS